MLTMKQIIELKDKLKAWFTKKVSRSGAKDDRILYYALEPVKKMIHIIVGLDNVDKMLKSLKEQDRYLKPFADGRLIRQISNADSWSLSFPKYEYESIYNWGGSFTMIFRQYFGDSRVVFKLISSADKNIPHQKLDYSELLRGGLSENRAQSLSILFSRTSIDDWIAKSGLFLDHEARDRVGFEIQEALKPIQAKLGGSHELSMA
jgi:hypothetical protein